MASLVDDEVNINEFREQLGRFELRSVSKMVKLSHAIGKTKSQSLSSVESVEQDGGLSIFTEAVKFTGRLRNVANGIRI